ncbi:MAG TPA: formate dehydrogenase accessory sulfurtransferase FdhD [Opitutaceae bacterium]|nr:formate dehydrogenase accessory sulfurtransferase FdhD [Opitutaceae bacterium]
MSNRALAPSTPAQQPAAPDPAVDCPGLRWADGRLSAVRERLVAEEPLAVEIAYERRGQAVHRVLSVTMRTPGEDADLALGFLYCEGLIDRAEDVLGGELLGENARGEKIPTWRVRLALSPRAHEVGRVSRGVMTSAACGLCGRTSLKGLRPPPASATTGAPAVSGDDVVSLPGRLRRMQRVFAETGGCHGAGLFDEAGAPLIVREDVGRHNAVDKVIGAALRGGVPTAGRTLVLSGRAGFELVQKAAAAGIALVVAVGAPSSLAVRLARDAGMTLVGFAREGRFNVYAQSGRLIRG